MNEARRFLQYITPGILFGFLTLFLVWLALPDSMSSVLNRCVFTQGNSIAILITTLLVSSALGYLFATIHHFCHWYLPIDKNIINHTEKIKSLRKRGLIPQPSVTPANPRLEALITVSVLWFERVEKGKAVGNSEDRVAAFGDLCHGAGTAHIASGFSLVTAMVICFYFGNWDPSASNVFRYIVMIVIGVLTVLLFHDAYRRTGKVSQQLYDQILEHALLEEQVKKDKGRTT